MACVAGLAIAQAPFTIVRPADGSKVREKVRIQIPKNSVPPGGYVGLFINGRFVEAVVPQASGKYYEYVLDTKGMGLPDGKTKLELVLYVDYSDQPKVVDRSSVNVMVSNKASIPLPANGVRLRYNFRPGTETVYSVDHKLSISTISQAQAQRGGHATELPVDSQTFRMVYAVDNSYSDGDGLLRIQARPPAGKNVVFMSSPRHPEGVLLGELQFGEMYMRVTNTGNEVFGSVPVSFPMEGTNFGPGLGMQWYYLETLPSLPGKTVKPGDVWQSRYQADAMVEGNIHDLSSLVSAIPVRAECVGLEWEMGHPCAKIHQYITAGSPGSEGRGDFSTDRVGIDETYWFALDKGVVIKFIVRETIDRLAGAPAAVPQGTGSGGGAPIIPGQPTAPATRPRRGAGGGAGGDDSNQPTIPVDLLQRRRRGGGGGEPGDAPAAVQQQLVQRAQTTAPRQTPRPAQQQAIQAGAQFVRINVEDVFVLEG